jgi:hypothetical protein
MFPLLVKPAMVKLSSRGQRCGVRFVFFCRFDENFESCVSHFVISVKFALSHDFAPLRFESGLRVFIRIGFSSRHFILVEYDVRLHKYLNK